MADEFQGRSRSQWRRPEGRRLLSTCRYRRSPSPSDRYRDRSLSPRRQLSPRRSRSRSPCSNYTIEDPEHRRRRLLAEKVMSIETYHRLLLDPHSPWAKRAQGFSMPIPVPLEGNENAGDYQQKFEFWLAQRNVTLDSMRHDVIRERSYRCGYAQWRVQTRFGQLPPRSGASSKPKRGGWETENYPPGRGYSPTRNPRRPAEEEQGYRTTSSTVAVSPASRFYDARRRISTLDKKTCQGEDRCCKNCDRNWDELYRRVKRLESIVVRLDVPQPSAVNGSSSSPYEIEGGERSYRDEQVATTNYIDLTEDVEMEADVGEVSLQHEHNPNNDDAQDETMQSRSVEITPTDSDTNNDTANAILDLRPIAEETENELELKPPLAQTQLLATYNQLNDQVLLKQKEKEKVVAQLELIIDGDESIAAELRTHVNELSGSIKTGIDQRDAAVAAVIVYSHADTREGLLRELEKLAAASEPTEQENLHEKCAGIAVKLTEKENELARLQKQLSSLNSLHVGTEESDSSLGKREAQELSSKIKLERASKASLETEQQKILKRLMKSSRHIQELTKKEILSME